MNQDSQHVRLKAARETWKNKFDFVFGVAGGSIGLGNIWRFPYLCYKNGGGAFLVPYLVFLIGAAIPVFFLEAAVGQFTSSAATRAWEIVPLMRGIGFATLVVCFNLHTYYMTVLCWALRYLVASFQSVLPWNSCDNSWNSQDCFVFGSNANESLSFGSTTEPELLPQTVDNALANVQYASHGTNSSGRVSSVTEFWEREVLAMTEGIHDLGKIKLDLFVCLVACWVIVYFCIWKGIRWTAKVIYFTATFPIIMLLVFLVRGVTLDGASEGIAYYLKLNGTKLLEAQVWVDAGTQVFYSYSLANSIMITMGSYNNYHHNVFRDTIIFAFLNSGTSFIAGFSVFGVLGFMAKEQNTTVDLVAESGPGLVFLTYPRAISLMPLPQLWAVLFFMMIFMLGLDSEFIGQESIVACIFDLRPRFFSGQWRREIFIALLFCCQFLIGLLTITNGGIYIFNMYDNYSAAGWTLFLIGICECLAVSWLFGKGKFWEHVCHMLNFRPFPWIKYAWSFVTPLLLSVVLVYSLVKYEPLTYNRTYTYPPWAQLLCWSFILMAILWIPGYAIYHLIKAKGSFKERLTKSCQMPDHLKERLLRQQTDSAHYKEPNGVLLLPTKDGHGPTL